jgi:hypothetical protein
MYCPKCAAANADDVKFCRSCGANLSLVPQAITGRLPESRPTRRRDKRRHDHEDDGPPNLAKGVTNLIMGLGFVVVGAAIFFSPGGRGWWWAMLFPAFSLVSKGIAQIVASKNAMGLSPGPARKGPAQTAMPPVPNTSDLTPEQFHDRLPPPSVTEGTTRHLDPTRDHYDEKR